MIIQGSFPGGKPHASILLQTKMGTHHTGRLTTYYLNSTRINLTSHGKPLQEGVLQKMETVFKTDFSNVRIHTGREAEAIGALAFTTGRNIYFATGQYNPNTPHGQQLLGHELTHVVQQKTGKINNPFRNGIAVVSDPGLEAEAERYSCKTVQLFRDYGFKIPNPVIQLLSIGTKNKDEISLLKSSYVVCVAKLKDKDSFIIGTNGMYTNDKLMKASDKGKAYAAFILNFMNRVEPLESWDINNCAELAALTKAIVANLDLTKLIFSTIKKPNDPGDPESKKSLDHILLKPFPPCNNCKQWLEPTKADEIEENSFISKVFNVGYKTKINNNGHKWLSDSG